MDLSRCGFFCQRRVSLLLRPGWPSTSTAKPRRERTEGDSGAVLGHSRSGWKAGAGSDFAGVRQRLHRSPAFRDRNPPLARKRVPHRHGQRAAARLIVPLPVGTRIRALGPVRAEEIEEVRFLAAPGAEMHPARPVTRVDAHDDQFRQPRAPDLRDERMHLTGRMDTDGRGRAGKLRCGFLRLRECGVDFFLVAAQQRRLRGGRPRRSRADARRSATIASAPEASPGSRAARGIEQRRGVAEHPGVP